MTRLCYRQVPGLSTIHDWPGAFYTTPDSYEIIDPLSDGNADGSSLGLNSTVHGDGAEEQQGVTEVPPPGQSVTAGNEEKVVTDEPRAAEAESLHRMTRLFHQQVATWVSIMRWTARWEFPRGR